MFHKVAEVLLIILIAGVSFYSQSNINDNIPVDERAQEIIRLSQKAIYKNAKIESIKSIFLKNVTTKLSKTASQIEGQDDLVRTTNSIVENELSIELPKRIKNTIFIYKPNDNRVENFTRTEVVTDGESHNRKTEIYRNGKLFDVNELFAKLPTLIPDAIKNQTKNTIEEATKNDKDIDLKDVWINVFPILLDSPWNPSYFRYIGKAKSNDKTANIIELITTSNEEIRLFFDEQNNLLLMLTIGSSSDIEKRIDSYYFSNYQLVNGVMVAKKIEFEGNITNNRKITTVGLPTILGSTRTVKSETIIEELKINPTFKPNTFAIKENQ